MGGRFPTTTATRMLPSLLAVIATDLDTSVVALGLYLGCAQMAGLTAPVVGWLVERSSPRRVIRLSLFAFCCAALSVAAAPTGWLFGVLLVVLAVTSVGYEASATAWITGTAPTGTTSRMLGRFEMAWSLGMIVGVPVATLLAQRTWRLSYLAVALTAAVMLSRLGAPAGPTTRATRPAVAGQLRAGWKAVVRSGWTTFLAYAAVGASAQVVIVVFGVWLTDRFGFEVASIGLVAFLFGFAELASAGATVRFTDRMGSPRAAGVGVVGLAACAVALALGSGQLVIGLIALTGLLAGHEFALISVKPMLAEAAPSEPGTGIGLGFGFAALARGGAAMLGAVAYDAGGMTAAAVLSVAFAAMAGILLALRRR